MNYLAHLTFRIDKRCLFILFIFMIVQPFCITHLRAVPCVSEEGNKYDSSIQNSGDKAGASSAKTASKKKVKIGFFFRHLGLRGTEVSSYNYADFNESLLDNESFIFFQPDRVLPGQKEDFPVEVSEKFKKRFQDRFFQCSNFEEVEELIKEKNIDILYNQKAGFKDTQVSNVCKNAVHMVFMHYDVHGDVYATLSKWLSDQRPSLHLPYVPYLVLLEETTETLRDKLGIPKDAVVFGRHGGYDTFDINFAQKTVSDIAKEYPKVYFVFLNTIPFCELPNVIFLPGSTDLEYKTKFINTCDAMIHARKQGETFGLSCAEFSIKNKPIITYADVPERAHLEILADKAMLYRNDEELNKTLKDVIENIEEVRSSNWDAYSERYNPNAIMKQFDQVFIQPLIQKAPKL